ncbi:MAG: leucine-rich repeat domain-containing protein [Candidatus Thorarchaeota archaeon]
MQKISFMKHDGNKEDIEIDDTTTRINLNGKGITQVDLTPIRSYTSSREIYLADNKIECLDLDPLSSCTDLQYLDVSDNPLQSVDLLPLRSCTNLGYLDISNTRLTQVDLSPLGFCKNLRIFKMSMNQLQDVDLSPLISCKVLRSIDLSYNGLLNIDLAPLSSSINLQEVNLENNLLQRVDVSSLKFGPDIKTDHGTSSWLNWGLSSDAIYERPLKKYPWTFLHQVVSHDVFGFDFRIQQDILVAMGLGDFGFVDCDLRDIFLSIAQDSDLEKACEILVPILVEHILASAESGGSTTGLNLEKLVNRYSKIYTVYKNIIEQRNADLENVSVGVSQDKIDFQELYLTAYGFEILNSLDSLTIDNVEDAFSELDYVLNVSESATPGVRMSEELRMCIWWIIKHKGMLWGDINKE